jgi:uncharacterized protein YjbJ (UPF0337 family)
MQQGYIFFGLDYIDCQETHMNKNEIKGRAEGKVKEATGALLDDKVMQIKGNAQKNVGKVKSGYFDGLDEDT